jgi:hypothetical protein
VSLCSIRRRGGSGLADGFGDEVAGALLGLVVVSEEVGEAALDVLAKPADDDDNKGAAGAEVVIGIEEEFIEGFVAGLGGEVGADEVVVIGWNIAETGAEDDCGVGELVVRDVGAGGLDREEVFVDAGDLSLGPKAREGEADGAVATAEVEGVLG